MTRGCGLPGLLEGLAEEALGDMSVAPGGEQEVNRLAFLV